MSRQIIFRIIYIACCFFSVLQSNSQSQFFAHRGKIHDVFLQDDEDEPEDTIRGLGYGINLGSYFANKATGNFYNGSGPISGYINEALGSRIFSLEERIDPNNFYFTNDVRAIQDYYNTASPGYTFPRDTHPTNMSYNPAFQVGLQLKYNFNRYSAIIGNFNFIKLKAVSQFTLDFIGTNTQGSLSNVRVFTIAGNEQRFNFNLGYRQGWMMGDYSNFYLQLGGSMLGTKFVDNYIEVVPGSRLQLLTQSLVVGQVAQQTNVGTGVGFGGFASAGIEFWLGKFSMDISFGLSRDKVVLFSYEKTVMNKWLQATFTI